MSCFSKQILDYFYNIQNSGRILKPEAIGRAGSKKEGTVIEFSWRVNDEIIQDARFRTFGDVNAIAISSIITTMMIGKSISDVLTITADDVLEHLQDRNANYLYLVDVALNALINTYENYLKKYAKANPGEKKVSEFAQNLRENLSKIESGEEFDIEDNYDLSNIAQLEENEEDSYLTNLHNYEKAVEENSIEKSLSKLLQGYTKIEDGNIKEERIEKPSYISTGKRGRPRRERTPEEIEADLNKVSRGRGRPRKERTPEEIEAELNKVSRGRGRPRKERTPEEIEAELNKVKRGRGRPRKIVDETIESAYEETSLEPKRRGRPRKERTSEEIEAELNKVSRGRGRPRKERTPEEIEAELNKVSRGRGRPRRERTPEEIEAELNKVKRGRGRPRKEEKSVFSITKLTQEDSNEIKEENNIPTNNFIEDSQELIANQSRGRGRPRKERSPEEIEAELNKVSRGRGRPKKERTPEEIEAELNKVSRGRGRPRKDSFIPTQLVDEPIEEKIIETKEPIVEKVTPSVSMENSFAPAQNKYGVGLKPNTQYSVNVKQTTITKTFTTNSNGDIHKKETNMDRFAGSVIRKYNIDNVDTSTNTLIEEPDEDDIREPLSDNVNDILAGGKSIEDALKALLEDED